MSMKEWAEQECRIACKRENPNFDFDSDEFDYGCSCYKSALKDYNSLCEDDHSGASFSFTRNILKRLLDGLPLTAITEDDFDVKNYEPVEDEWLDSQGLVSDIQCKRMSSLFRLEHKDGRVVYKDIDQLLPDRIHIYPSETFAGNKHEATKNSYAIHLCAHSWHPTPWEKIRRFFGLKKIHKQTL